MQQQNRFADLTGALKTPKLIGRNALLAAVDDLLTLPSEKPTVLFLTGSGGIGKTRFLHEIRDRASANTQTVLAPREIIDLYHVYTHTPDGLVDAMWNVLPAAEASRFPQYEQEKLKYGKQQVSGDFRGLGEQHNLMLEAFWRDLFRALDGKKLLLLLDTAEKALYTIDRTPDAEADVAASWTWLAKSLPSIPNITLVVAGRSRCLQLSRLLDNTKVKVEYQDIPPFSEDESLAYWDAVIGEARKSTREDLAERLSALDIAMRQAAHYYTGGLPILLSLLIDYLGEAEMGTIPPELRVAPETVRASFLRDPETLRRDLELLFIDRLVNSSRTGDTIRALGRTPKGADAELLSRLMNISLNEAQSRLQDVRHLSFVKQRPLDKRYFLHDVMYEILDRHIYSHPNDENEAREAEEKILAYYKDLLDMTQQELAGLMQPVWEGRSTKLDFSRYSQITAQRQTILAEIVFYRLRQNPGKGFLRYYRYVREAILSGQILLDLLLQTELLTFWTERDPDWTKEEIGGVPRYVVESFLYLRPVTRAWAEGNYALAIQRVGDIKRDHSDIFRGRGTRSIVDAWEAYALIYQGGAENLARAHRLLSDGIELLDPITSAGGEQLDEIRIWRVKAVLAFCYRVRGYLNRVQGNLHSAIKDYRVAARLGRDTNFRIELGRTLNDMGFAMSELGWGADGQALVNDALTLTTDLGQYALATFSVNTLAMIAIKQGNYTEAREHATRALSLFRVLDYRRGIGLALTALAEATRRYSRAVTSNPDEIVRQLREARDLSREALGIFSGDAPEPIRQVEALIEIGCACRDWVRVRLEHHSPLDNIERLIEESKNALEDAANLAGSSILHRHVDALVNLAWLGYYANDEQLLNSAATRADKAIPMEYRIDPATGTPKISGASVQRLLWPQLGKLLLLRGFRSLDVFLDMFRSDKDGEQQQVVKSLHIAVEHLSLGLEYSAFYSENYQGLNQAKQQIYEHFRDLSPTILEQVALIVEEFEIHYKIGPAAENHGSQMRRLLEARALWYGETSNGE